MKETGTISLDGSEGEGGGQVLRTALSLSLISGRPFHLFRIRAHRSPPGLRPQHLACVRGAEAISDSSVRGAELDSQELWFTPGKVSSGDYVLDVGTAGATTLVFQCLFYPLALAQGGTLRLKGGTHVSHSPSFHYLSQIWQVALRAYGLSADFKLRSAGFYPRGGGDFEASISPLGTAPDRVELPSRGTLGHVQVSSMVADLPFHIAERQGVAAAQALKEKGILCDVENLPLPTTGSPGSVVFIRAEFENTLAGFCALGEKGKRAEEVGREAASALSEFMSTSGALDAHLADQLLLPAALLAAGSLGPSRFGTTVFTTQKVTGHLKTNAAIIERFLPINIQFEESGRVQISPRA